MENGLCSAITSIIYNTTINCTRIYLNLSIRGKELSKQGICSQKSKILDLVGQGTSPLQNGNQFLQNLMSTILQVQRWYGAFGIWYHPVSAHSQWEATPSEGSHDHWCPHRLAIITHVALRSRLLFITLQVCNLPLESVLQTLGFQIHTFQFETTQRIGQLCWQGSLGFK